MAVIGFVDQLVCTFSISVFDCSIETLYRIGLWVASGQACAGLCGPRYRWEEDEAEKRASVYSDNASETDALPWNWREGTQARLQEAYDFCYTVRPSSRWGKKKKDISDMTGNELPAVDRSPGFDGMEQIMAAVGFPSQPLPARRGVLTEDLFERPKDEPALSSIIPAVRRASREKEGPSGSGPLMSLPYPFTGYKNQISSDDQVPFPPSPKRSRTSQSSSPEEESGDVEDVEDGDEGQEVEVGASEEPSSQSPSQPRTSGSLSSLGRPVSSRYPFQFRHPARGTSASTRGSHLTPHSPTLYSSPSASSRSHRSRSTQSTGNIPSASPGSPSAGDSSFSAGPSSPTSSNIPMPPRHPQPSRGRPRAGTVPVGMPSSPTPVAFPRAASRPRAHTRVDSDITQAFGGSQQSQPPKDDDEEPSGEQEFMEQPIAEGAHEEDEEEDSVGLLSVGPSPRSSFVGLGHRPSNLSRRSRLSRSSESSPGSRSRTGSAPSRSRTGSSARSRAHSLIQTLSQASRSSVELVQNVRIRANSSMARLEEDSPTHSPSGSSVNGNDNHTFGIPLLPPRESAEEQIEEVPTSRPDSAVEPQLRHSASNVAPSQRTVSPTRYLEVPNGGGGGGGGSLAPSGYSHPGISTAAPSFVTGPATLEGSTESSGRTVSSAHGHMVEGTWRPA